MKARYTGNYLHGELDKNGCHLIHALSLSSKKIEEIVFGFLYFQDSLIFYCSAPLSSALWVKFYPMETICLKCQILFSWINKKNITNLSSAELVQIVVKVYAWFRLLIVGTLLVQLAIHLLADLQMFFLMV